MRKLRIFVILALIVPAIIGMDVVAERYVDHETWIKLTCEQTYEVVQFRRCE